VSQNPKVGLFVTCLADLLRPSVGFAALRLLEQAGCEVVVPDSQTCCGQPGANAGVRAPADALAKQVIAAFEGFDALVAPSASCAGEIKFAYPKRLADDPDWGPRAQALADKSFELMSYLDHLGFAPTPKAFNAQACYHDTCSALRGFGISDAPRKLLAGVEGLELSDMADPGACCGFGGSFSAAFPEISQAMGEAKFQQAGGKQMIIGGDLGCLIHMQALADKKGEPIRCVHAAEILAGLAEEGA